MSTSHLVVYVLIKLKNTKSNTDEYDKEKIRKNKLKQTYEYEMHNKVGVTIFYGGNTEAMIFKTR